MIQSQVRSKLYTYIIKQSDVHDYIFKSYSALL